MDKDEALKLALDDLIAEYHMGTSSFAKRVDDIFKQALAAPTVQDSTCSETLRAQGKAYPRTCKKCGKGPCIGASKQPPAAQPAPVQEPVAVTYKEVADTMNALWGGTLKQVQIAMELANKKLYTTPPAAQRQWVGLTDEEWQDLSDRYGMILFGRFKNEIEDKLKEKNT
jgi:uncharacterized low-complexity protein